MLQGFGWAIAKCLAEAGAEISLGVWVPALNIFGGLSGQTCVPFEGKGGVCWRGRRVEAQPTLCCLPRIAALVRLPSASF